MNYNYLKNYQIKIIQIGIFYIFRLFHNIILNKVLKK